MGVGEKIAGEIFGIWPMDLCFRAENADFGCEIGHLVKMGIGGKNGVKCFCCKGLRW